MSRTDDLPKTARELDGPTRAAILLLTLEPDAASAMLKHMPVDAVEEITRMIARLGQVPGGLAADVVRSFYEEHLASQGLTEGGLDYAATLLKEVLDPKLADGAIEQLEAHGQKSPFSFLRKAGTENLFTFIQDEHPQTVALIVSHLPHKKASEILDALPDEKQIEVVRRMAHMDQTNPDVIREVELGLASRLSTMLMPATERVGGVETVAEVLNLCDRATEKNILEGIENDDPDLVENIRRLMFVFEDILLVDDKGIQAVLKEVDNDELCLSLRTSSEELQEKIFTNMSARASELIREEMEYMGPVRLSDVEAAQQRIVDIVRRLEDAGEIIIAGRGGEGDQIV